MSEDDKKAGEKRASGYHGGDVETVISVEAVTAQAAAIAQDVTNDDMLALAKNDPYLSIDTLKAGYGRMEILHGINLHVARKQSLCLIGPNGAGKSTILHAIFPILLLRWSSANARPSLPKKARISKAAIF